MIKLLTVVGARPQFIKSSAISRSISKNYWKEIDEVIVHTGQHYDHEMSNLFFKELKIPKEKYNLKIGSSNHAHQTAQIMTALDEVVEKEKPDAILLYGDTNSTLAACLVAVKRHIPTIHVEAGVRSFNKKFPEEVNRLICDHVSSLLFVPSDAGILNLKKEGFDTGGRTPDNKVLLNYPKVYRCGDIMFDNTLYFKEKADSYFETLVDRHNLPEIDYFLVTAHRPSNLNDPLKFKSILSFFHFAIENLDKKIIFPIHPRTLKLINSNQEFLSLIRKEGIYCIPPVSFIEMIGLEKNADIVVTDSGGVQKEAFFMKKPCLIMLDETPWIELVESKNARLVNSSYDLLCKGAKYFLQNKPVHYESIYGDGTSANFICEKIIENIKK